MDILAKVYRPEYKFEFTLSTATNGIHAVLKQIESDINFGVPSKAIESNDPNLQSKHEISQKGSILDSYSKA